MSIAGRCFVRSHAKQPRTAQSNPCPGSACRLLLLTPASQSAAVATPASQTAAVATPAPQTAAVATPAKAQPAAPTTKPGGHARGRRCGGDPRGPRARCAEPHADQQLHCWCSVAQRPRPVHRTIHGGLVVAPHVRCASEVVPGLLGWQSQERGSGCCIGPAHGRSGAAAMPASTLSLRSLPPHPPCSLRQLNGPVPPSCHAPCTRRNGLCAPPLRC